MLSSRGKTNADRFDIPWRYAVAPTYNKETNPEGVISFGLAEHVPVRSDIAEYINNKVKFNTNSVCYGSMATEHKLEGAAAAHLNKYLKPLKPIEPRMVMKTNGCTAAGNMLAFALADFGDGVLISRPVYGRFELDYGAQGGVDIVYADTDPDEAFSPTCIEKYEKALADAKERGVKIRAVVLVNPHNPVGRCYPTETLIEILKFCNTHQLHLISDEIYALCDFASGGLRLGFIVSHNAELRRSLSAISRFNGPSSAVETIGATILQDEEFVSEFTEKSRQDLAYSYRIATSILEEESINYIKGGNAGFFVYVDLSPYLPNDDTLQPQEREFALAQKLLDNGLFLHPGEEHCKYLGWFRLVYSHDEHVLREGLRRLVKTLKSLQQPQT
ncbi:pyridoxal phosphate-dependent transferase [Aspergillus granulosus]|uniref:Pyridoxal phosphate-dependent transferase n=1 Tax=Aspergillus granulosus TaxID=176169 RepID=A0ABR4H6J9_9EURO